MREWYVSRWCCMKADGVKRNGWMLVKAETPTEAWKIYDERSVA